MISYLEHAGKGGRFLATGSGYKTALESKDIPAMHQTFFNSRKLYYIDHNNRCFLHVGFKRNLPFEEQKITDYYWGRSLCQDAVKQAANGEDFTMVPDFKEIYIGYSQTIQRDTDKPLQAFNIYNVDTGAGRLTIMDVETKAYWQYDLTTDFYPGYLTEHKKVRRRRDHMYNYKCDFIRVPNASDIAGNHNNNIF